MLGRAFPYLSDRFFYYTESQFLLKLLEYLESETSPRKTSWNISGVVTKRQLVELRILLLLLGLGSLLILVVLVKAEAGCRQCCEGGCS